MDRNKRLRFLELCEWNGSGKREMLFVEGIEADAHWRLFLAINTMSGLITTEGSVDKISLPKYLIDILKEMARQHKDQ